MGEERVCLLVGVFLWLVCLVWFGLLFVGFFPFLSTWSVFIRSFLKKLQISEPEIQKLLGSWWPFLGHSCFGSEGPSFQDVERKLLTLQVSSCSSVLN